MDLFAWRHFNMRSVGISATWWLVASCKQIRIHERYKNETLQHILGTCTWYFFETWFISCKSEIHQIFIRFFVVLRLSTAWNAFHTHVITIWASGTCSITGKYSLICLTTLILWFSVSSGNVGRIYHFAHFIALFRLLMTSSAKALVCLTRIVAMTLGYRHSTHNRSLWKWLPAPQRRR